MTLRANLPYGSSDRSALWNEKFRTRVSRGIFSGGLISPVSGELKIEVGGSSGNFGAVGYDGMFVWDNEGTTKLTVVDGIIQVVVCYSKYQLNAAPILQYEVLTATGYFFHPDINYLIVL